MYTDIFIVRRDCVFRNFRIFPFLEKAVFSLLSSRKDTHVFIFVMQKRYGNVVFSDYGNLRKFSKISSFRKFSRIFTMRKERILCSDSYRRTIKMKPIDVKLSVYLDFNAESNDKDPKFEVGDHVGVSKYKNIFAKSYTSNWFEEDFAVEKVKETVR